jgi:rod shape-determining protein MreC
METILGRFRNLIVLAAILFAQIVGLAVQVKRPAQQGDTRLIRVWAAGTITPVEKAIVNTQKFFYNTWHNYLYLRGVRRENRQLKAQLDQMKLEQVRLKEDAEMARRIQYLLAFKEQHIDGTVAAQVIGTSGSDQSRVLYIDKGSGDGLKTDMAVITPNGIVGKIVQVFPDSAQVLPINDQMSGVGVALKTTRLQGILRGGAGGTTTVQYIMADERVQPGEDVITSGGDRIFPKGLPVGKVVDVQPGKDMFLNIRVTPSVQLDGLEEVLVITKVTDKPADVKDLGPIRASDILAERLPTVPEKPPAGANAAAAGSLGSPGSAAVPGGTGNATGAKPAGVGAPGAATTTQRSTGAGAPANRPATAGTPTTAGTGTAIAKPSTGPGAAATTGTGGAHAPGASGGAARTATTPPPSGAGTSTPAKPPVRVIDNDAPTTAAPARKPPSEATPPSTTPPPGDNPPQR